MSAPEAQAPMALDGVVVLDFSRVLSGPYATMVLGDLGATVIKVEHPHGGDETRTWGPPWAGGESAYYLATNRNKRSITLDLKAPADRRRALELAGRADVLVENFRPGTMKRLGLAWPQLRRGNPRLVYCSLSGFGGGAGAEMPGYDFIVQAMGGLMSITGEPDGEPLKVGVAVVDVLAGLFATVGIMAALRARASSGRGQLVEVNLLSALLAGLVNQASAYVTAGQVPQRMGNAHPQIAPYETLPTGEGQLVLAVGNDGQFARLCHVLGLPEVPGDARFHTNAARLAHRGELRALLERALAGDGARSWSGRLVAEGVPAGVVNDMGEAFALASALGLDPTVTVVPGAAPQVRSPLRLSDTPVSYRLHPPALGEHSAEMLSALQRGGPAAS